MFEEKDSKSEIKQWRRWTIYLIGLTETVLFGGCIFGWGQLVHILKNERIFLSLCSQNGTLLSNADNISFVFAEDNQTNVLPRCKEQDEKFALVYSIGAVVYGTPGIIQGLILHHFGLAFSRISASLMLGTGFLTLGFVTEENGDLLYLSMVLLALGAGQLRMSGLQFCNLFPKYRSTALAVISGSYSSSPGLFMIFPIGMKLNMTYWDVSLCLAAIAFLSLPATFLMPRQRIPYDSNDSGTKNLSSEIQIPLFTSLFSISSVTGVYWMVTSLGCIVFFTNVFNSWITEISKTNEEAGFYSFLYSVTAFVSPVVSFLPGILTDFLYKRHANDPVAHIRLKNHLRSPIIPMVSVVLLAVATLVCLFFKHLVAIYCSLTFVAILRPCIFAVASAFYRIRFPPYHFDRIIGAHSTVISILHMLQYPLFLWSKNDLHATNGFLIGVIALSLIFPFHLLSNSYMTKICNQLLPEPEEGKEK